MSTTPQHPEAPADGERAPARALPDGWIALSIQYNGREDETEEVAYGPKIMMDRLRKWLDKYFARVIADRDAATPQHSVTEQASADSWMTMPTDAGMYWRCDPVNGTEFPPSIIEVVVSPGGPLATVAHGAQLGFGFAGDKFYPIEANNTRWLKIDHPMPPTDRNEPIAFSCKKRATAGAAAWSQTCESHCADNAACPAFRVHPLASTATTQPEQTVSVIYPPDLPKFMPGFPFDTQEELWDHAVLTGWRAAQPALAIPASTAATQPEHASIGDAAKSLRFIERNLRKLCDRLPMFSGGAELDDSIGTAARVAGELERAALAIPASTAASEQQAVAWRYRTKGGKHWQVTADPAVAGTITGHAGIEVRPMVDAIPAANERGPSGNYIAEAVTSNAKRLREEPESFELYDKMYNAELDRILGPEPAADLQGDGAIYAQHAAHDLAANARNAARYEWLRGRYIDAGMIEINLPISSPYTKVFTRVGGTGAELDALIDKAMAGGPL